jgi:hypothetical protein
MMEQVIADSIEIKEPVRPVVCGWPAEWCIDSFARWEVVGWWAVLETYPLLYE